MNRYKFTDGFVARIKDEIVHNRKTHPFVKRFSPTIVANQIFVENKPIVPAKNVAALLKIAVETTSAPLGIRSLQHFMSQYYHGITRGMITDFLRSLPRLENMKSRPPTTRRARDSQKKEGVTQGDFRKNINVLGVDLVKLTKASFSNKYKGEWEYIFVCVHKYSSFIWGALMRDPDSKTALAVFR